jgi:hypothetical protein
MTWQDVKIDDDNGRLRVSSVGPSIDYVDIYGALRVYLGARRGWETWTVTRTRRDGSTYAEEKKCPKTTYGDVVQLSLFWSTTMNSTRRTLDEMDSRRKSWKEAHGEVSALAKGADPNGVYPKNREWWLAAMRAAIAIDIEREDGVEDNKLDAVVGYFTDSVGDALTWAGKKVEEGANVIGHLAGAATRGFFDDLGVKQLLIGVAVIGGAVVLIPAMSKKQARKEAVS